MTFAGTLAATAEPADLDYDGNATLKGFNLVGNPYPCNATITNDFYIIDENNMVSLAEEGREIAPCEGIFVKATDTDQTVTFSKANSAKGANSKDCFDLVITQGKANIDRARVRFGEGIGMEKYTLVTTLNTLLSNPNLPIIIQNAELITENVNKSTEQLNTLLHNDIPKMTGTFTKAGENVTELTDKMNQLDLQATLNNVNQTITSVHSMVEQMQSPNGTLGRLMTDPSIYDNLNHTVQSADSLVTDLKAHPKRYVHFSVFGKK